MMTNRAWLGLLVAALLFAACDSSKDSLLTSTGKGGNSNGGAGGTTQAGGRGGGAGSGGGDAGMGGNVQTGGRGGAGGAFSCATATCTRPYECVRECGGPIIGTPNCCQCEPPLFDNFLNLACGGSGGGGAAGGAAGSGPGGRGGSGGSAGNGGRGGSAGGAAGAAGSGPGGRGGTGGAAGTAGGADGGTDARACEMWSCARPYVCKLACGGPVLPNSNNCCPCEAPAFDDFQGMVCGDGGAGAVSYLGCRFIGGIDRIVVAKRDTSRDLCVNVVLGAPPAPAGLTLPQNWGLEAVLLTSASVCPTRGTSTATQAGPVTGTVELLTTMFVSPQYVNADLIVTTPGTAEAIVSRNIDVSPACP